MLRIIRASSMGGAGCLINDFGSSSIDESIEDQETEFDCSVRYLCELDRPASCQVEFKAAFESKQMAEMEPEKVKKDEDKSLEQLEISNLASGEIGTSLQESESCRSGEYVTESGLIF